MEKVDQAKLVYEQLYSKLAELNQPESMPDGFYQALSNGKTTVYQKEINETKIFDEEWVDKMMQFLPSVDKIIRNPKSTLRYDEDIIAIEKVKKINSQSIRHLSAHTHYIRTITDDGMVIPSKLLTSEPEIEYATYENRFIKTLINRLFLFVKMRRDIVVANIKSYDRIHFNFDSDFILSNTEVKIDLDVTLSNEKNDVNLVEKGKALLKKVEYIYKLILGMKQSQFMVDLLREAKEVHAPIMRTQVIIKNVDFGNAYKLWVFLDKYNTMVFEKNIITKDLDIDVSYLRDVQGAILTAFLGIAMNQEKRKDDYENLIWEGEYFNKIEQLSFHPDDDFGNPEPLELEDSRINQYYLDKNVDIFRQSLERHESENKTYETSVKRALRDTIRISNSIYESFFGITEKDDIFKIIKKETDPEVLLESARKRARVSKYIREVKEIDFRDTIRLEKKMLDQLEKSEINFAHFLIKNASDEAETLGYNMALENNTKLVQLEKDNTEELMKFIAKQDSDFSKLRKENNQKLREIRHEADFIADELVKDKIKEINKEFKTKSTEINKRYKSELQVMHQAIKVKEKEEATRFKGVQKTVDVNVQTWIEGKIERENSYYSEKLIASEKQVHDVDKLLEQAKKIIAATIDERIEIFEHENNRYANQIVEQGIAKIKLDYHKKLMGYQNQIVNKQAVNKEKLQKFEVIENDRLKTSEQAIKAENRAKSALELEKEKIRLNQLLKQIEEELKH